MKDESFFHPDQAMLTWIIPVYNGEGYIRQSIESILRQPCNDFEIIVIDDGSTDNTFRIVSDINANCITVIRKENGGVSSARNQGIEAATSQYIAFLDADDVLCKDAYNEQIHTLLQQGKYDLLSFAYFNGDQELKRGSHFPVNEGEVQCSKKELNPFKYHSSFIYHRNLFKGHNAVRFPVGIKIQEDATFMFLIYQNADRIMSINQSWFIRRNNVMSVTHQVNGFDYIIQHAIPAWQWCRDRCAHMDAKHECDCLIFSEAVEYIRLSCSAGIPLQKANSVLDLPAVKTAMSNYDILWKSSKKEYEAYIANPRKYWMWHMLSGIPNIILKPIARMRFVRRMFYGTMFDESIENMV